MESDQPHKTLSNHDFIMRAAKSVPPISTVVTELVSTVGDPTSEIFSIAAIIERDPALSAHVLREANSASSGGNGGIGEVDLAVMRLGMARVLQVAVSRDLQGSMKKDLPAYGISGEQFARNAYARSRAAEICFRRSSEPIGRELVVAALLCDFGKIVMEPYLDREIADRFIDLDRTGVLMERELLGTDHGEISAYLLKNWGLPDSITEATRKHEHPESHAGASLVHIADRLAEHLVLGYEVSPDDTRLDMSLHRLGLGNRFDELLHGVGATLEAEVSVA